jgi:ArsR family transcriptional regulator, arsenate/arsenite/antimonite-responsive transcriptional repressor / arsenate reductase (thioredoxin)
VPSGGLDQAGLINQLGLIYPAGLVNEPDPAPPSFLRLAGHPLRWRLLRELARSDRQVRELTALLGQPQSLVSYHLGRLLQGELVRTRRSAADRRDAYYSLDLARCGELLTATGAALHPGLRLLQPAHAEPRPTPHAPPARVLFVCTGNSARSPMAEALTRHMAPVTVAASSAGSHPRPLHPNAVRVMREHGIDLGGRHPMHLRDLAQQPTDYVVSLCDRVRERLPRFPDHPERIHWSIADPARDGDGDEETYPAFQQTAAELATRVRFLLHHIQSGPPRQEVAAHAER